MLATIIGWLYEAIGSIFDNVIDMFLNSLDLSLSAIVSSFPFLVTGYEMFQAIGIGILICIALWQLLKFFGGDLSQTRDTPIQVLVRAVLAGAMIYFGGYILEIIVDLAKIPFDSMVDTDGVTTFQVSHYGWGTDGIEEAPLELLNLIIILLIGYNILKLLLEVCERYLMIGILVYSAPLIYPTLTSSTTISVFQKWLGMFFGQCAIMTISAWMFKLIISGFDGLDTAGHMFLFQFLLVLAMCKIAQRIDTYMQQLGIGVAVTGGNMLGEAMGMLGMMRMAGGRRRSSSSDGDEGNVDKNAVLGAGSNGKLSKFAGIQGGVLGGAIGAASAGIRGMKSGTNTAEIAQDMKTSFSKLSGVSSVKSGASKVKSGIQNIKDGNVAKGIGNVAVGGLKTVGGAANLAGLGAFTYPIRAVAGSQAASAFASRAAQDKEKYSAPDGENTTQNSEKASIGQMTESEQQRAKEMNLSAQEIAAQNETRNGVDSLYVDENGNVKVGDNSKNAGAYINEGSTVTPSNGKSASEQDRKKFNDWVDKEHPVDATGNRITPLQKNQALSSQAAQAYNAAHKSDYHGLNGSVSAVGKTMAQTLATGVASNSKVLSTLNETAKASPLSAKEALFNPNSADFTTNNPALATSLAKSAFGEDAAKVITGKEGWEINSLAAKSTGEGGRGLTIGMSKQNADGTVETASYDVLNNNAMTGDAKQYSDAQMFAEGLSGRMKSASLEGADGVSENVMIRHNKDGDEGIAAGAGVDPNQFNNADPFEVDEGIAGAALGVTAAAAFDQNNGFAENADVAAEANIEQNAEPELQDINTLMAENGNVYLAHSDNEGSYITADGSNGNNADDTVSNFITENANRMDDSAAAIAADTIRDNPEMAEQVAWGLNDGANEEIGNAALKAGFGDVIRPDDNLSNFKYETTENGGHIISADRTSANGSKDKIQICDAAAMHTGSDSSNYKGFRTSINDNAAFIKSTPDYSMSTSASANGELPATARQNGLSFNGNLNDTNTKLVGPPDEVGKFVAQNANYGGTTAQNGDAGNSNVNSQVNNAMVNAVKNSPEAARSAISSLNDKVDNNSALTSAMFNGAAHGTQYAGQNIQIGSMTPVTNGKGEHGVIATEKPANGQDGRQFAVFATKGGGVSITDGANYNSSGIDSSLHPKTNSNGTFEPTQAQTSKGVAMEVNGGAISGRQTLTAEQAKNYNNAVAEYNKGVTASQRIPKIAENGTGIASNEGAAVYNKANSRMVSTSGISEPIAAGQTLTEAQARNYNRAADEYNKENHKIDRIAENGTGIASQAGADIYNKANSQAISGSSVSNPIAAGQTLTAEQAKNYNNAVAEYNKGVAVSQRIPQVAENGTGVASRTGADIYNKANSQVISGSSAFNPIAAGQTLTAEQAKSYNAAVDEYNKGIQNIPRVAVNGTGIATEAGAAVYNRANEGAIAQANNAIKQSAVELAASPNISADNAKLVANTIGNNKTVASGMWTSADVAQNAWGNLQGNNAKANSNVISRAMFSSAEKDSSVATAMFNSAAEGSQFAGQNIQIGSVARVSNIHGQNGYVATEQKTDGSIGRQFQIFSDGNGNTTVKQDFGDTPRVNSDGTSTVSALAASSGLTAQVSGGAFTPNETVSGERAKTYNQAVDAFNATVPSDQQVSKIPEGGTGEVSPRVGAFYNKANSYISGPENCVNSAVGQYVVSQGRNSTITQGQTLTAEQAKSYNAAVESYNAGVPEIKRIQKVPEDGTGIASGAGANLYNAGNDNPDIVANTIRNSSGASNAAWQAVQDNGVAVNNPQIATAMVQQASGKNSAYANTTFESITPTQNGFIAKGYDSGSNKPVEYHVSGLNGGEFSDSGAVFTKNYGSLSRNADGSVHLSQAAQDDGMYISGAGKSAVINGTAATVGTACAQYAGSDLSSTERAVVGNTIMSSRDVSDATLNTVRESGTPIRDQHIANAVTEKSFGGAGNISGIENSSAVEVGSYQRGGYNNSSCVTVKNNETGKLQQYEIIDDPGCVQRTKSNPVDGARVIQMPDSGKEAVVRPSANTSAILFDGNNGIQTRPESGINVSTMSGGKTYFTGDGNAISREAVQSMSAPNISSSQYNQIVDSLINTINRQPDVAKSMLDNYAYEIGHDKRLAQAALDKTIGSPVPHGETFTGIRPAVDKKTGESYLQVGSVDNKTGAKNCYGIFGSFNSNSTRDNAVLGEKTANNPKIPYKRNQQKQKKSISVRKINKDESLF